MKRKIQIIFALFLLAAVSFSNLKAQTIELISAETEVLTTPDKEEVKAHASFRNLIFSDITAKATIEVVSMTSGHKFSVCTPAYCSPLQSKTFTTSAFSIGGMSTVEEKDFYVTLVFEDIKGTSTFKVSIFNEDDQNDKIEYDLSFNVDEKNNVTEIISNNSIAFPNPAVSSAQIKFDEALSNNADFVLYSASGEVVSSSLIEAASQFYSIDLAGLAQGAYFYKVSMNGKSVSFGKINISR